MICKICKNEIVVSRGQVRKDYDWHKKCNKNNTKKTKLIN